MKPDRSRKVFRYFAVRLDLIFIVMVIVVAVILTRFPPTRVCTLIGCYDSLTLEFSHPLRENYTLLLTSSTGETTSITCTTSSAAGQISPTGNLSAMCRPNSIIISNYTPQKVTITWNGGSYNSTAPPPTNPSSPMDPIAHQPAARLPGSWTLPEAIRHCPTRKLTPLVFSINPE
jgi:hypothetical protein